MTATSKVTIAMEGMPINDDVVPDAALRLIRAFLRLTDTGRRQKVLECAERLAEEAESAKAPAFATTAPSAESSNRSLFGPTE